MNFRIRTRLVALAIGASLMIIIIAFIGLKAKKELEALHVRLNQVVSESFSIPVYFNEHIRRLNDLLYQYGQSRVLPNMTDFTNAIQDLELWIDAQKKMLGSNRGEAIGQQIDAAYDDYRQAARQLCARLAAKHGVGATVDEYEILRKHTQRLITLNRDLREAHLESRAGIMGQANHSLGVAWTLQVVSLAALLVFAAALIILAYRDLIVPLRAKLVEEEALLARQEKLASLGLLAAGIAHEIRNPLTAIKGAVFLQKKKFEVGSKEYADTRLVEREILRLERIVNEFLLFARRGELQVSPTTAGAPLRAVHALLADELAKNNIQLLTEDTPSLPVKMDEAQIEQVLINLVQNAAESIGENGTIKLSARGDFRRIGQKEQEIVTLEVSDTGKGIAPEVEKRLFDPFFTTKEGGTGLGLSIAAAIVQKHGGAIEYQTQLDHGTVFRILLQVNQE